MAILITGGAGYIGSHVCVELLQADHRIVVLDNFSNSHPEALFRVAKITGKEFLWLRGDIRDSAAVEATLREQNCTAVVHLAGLKAVGESVDDPLSYYDNNVVGTLRLLEAMQSADVSTLVFSSSATVYGEPEHLPMREDHRLAATSPYGRTKLVIEGMLQDFHRARPTWKIALLRYFNPAGAHDSGLIGEDPRGTPNNLMPFIAQVAIGRRAELKVFGRDYPTPDGTGLRDYIHVVDLAEGHRRALEYLEKSECIALNLGTGRGHSVLELIDAFSKASSARIPFSFAPRRPGDVAASFASTQRAEDVLGWRAVRNLETMCVDTWRWQSRNRDGYAGDPV